MASFETVEGEVEDARDDVKEGERLSKDDIDTDETLGVKIATFSLPISALLKAQAFATRVEADGLDDNRVNSRENSERSIFIK